MRGRFHLWREIRRLQHVERTFERPEPQAGRWLGMLAAACLLVLAALLDFGHALSSDARPQPAATTTTTTTTTVVTIVTSPSTPDTAPVADGVEAGPSLPTQNVTPPIASQPAEDDGKVNGRGKKGK